MLSLKLWMCYDFASKLANSLRMRPSVQLPRVLGAESKLGPNNGCWA